MKKGFLLVSTIIALITITISIYLFVIFIESKKLSNKSQSNQTCNLIHKEDEPMLLDPQGIEVDKNGNFYIHNNHFMNSRQIHVYNNDFKYMHTIEIKNLGSISYNINKDNNLEVYFERASYVKEYDKEGCIVSTEKFKENPFQMKKEISFEENNYNINKNFWGYITISKNIGDDQTTLYEMPTKYYLVIIFQALFKLILTVSAVFAFVIKIRKIKN